MEGRAMANLKNSKERGPFYLSKKVREDTYGI